MLCLGCDLNVVSNNFTEELGPPPGRSHLQHYFDYTPPHLPARQVCRRKTSSSDGPKGNPPAPLGPLPPPARKAFAERCLLAIPGSQCCCLHGSGSLSHCSCLSGPRVPVHSTKSCLGAKQMMHCISLHLTALFLAEALSCKAASRTALLKSVKSSHVPECPPSF